MVSAKDSGQLQGQWSAARTVVSCKDSGQDSGQRQGQWSVAKSPYGLCGRKATLKLCEQLWRVWSLYHDFVQGVYTKRVISLYHDFFFKVL